MDVTPELRNGPPVVNPQAMRVGPAVVKPRYPAYPTVSAYAMSWGTEVAAMMAPLTKSLTGLN